MTKLCLNSVLTSVMRMTSGQYNKCFINSETFLVLFMAVPGPG